MLERRMPRPPKVGLRVIRLMYRINQDTVARRLGIASETLRTKEYTSVRGQKVDSIDRYACALGGRLEMWIVMPDGTGLQIEVDEKVDRQYRM